MGQKQAETGTHRDSDTALLLIDFINDLEFPGGDRFLLHAMGAAKRAAALKKRAKHETFAESHRPRGGPPEEPVESRRAQGCRETRPPQEGGIEPV